MKPSLGIYCLAVLVSAAAAGQQDTPSIGQADGASETGLQFALRTGFMLPFGKAAERHGSAPSPWGPAAPSPQPTISDLVLTRFLPIWIEGGYRFNPNLFGGVFFQYAFAFTNNIYGGNSGSDLRVGGEGHYHFMPGHMADPWLGLGVGYEWLRVSENDGGFNIDATLHGFEFVDFQAGIDFMMTRQFSVGPFAALTLAQYRTASIACAANGCFRSSMSYRPEWPQSIDKRALHELLIFGVRGTFGP